MGDLIDFVHKARKEGVGFRMTEVMLGTHKFEEGAGPPGEHPMEFRVVWGPDHLTKWLNPLGDTFLTQELEGHVTVGGLCSNVPCKGTLELDYFGEHKIRYTFDFQLNDTRYRFVGEKVNIQLWNLLVSHTTCYGVLTEADSGKLVSKSVTYFKFSTAPAFVASFRLK